MCDYSRGAEMEKLQYAEALVREFLAFRGFTNTLQAFEMELSSDIAKGFEGDKILDLLFSVYIPKFQADKLLALLSFFKNCFSSLSDTVLASTLSKLELSILRYYIVYAIQSARKDKVVEFLGIYGNDLLQSNPDWTPWFAIPYVKIPSSDPQFRVYFSKEWYQPLRLSLRNFFNEIFHESRIPTIMKISSEKDTVNHLKKDIKQLNLKLSQLQTLLEEKEAQLCQLRSNSSAPSILEESSQNTNNSTSAVGKDEEKVCPFGGLVKDISGVMMPKPGNESLSMESIHVEDDNVSDTAQTPHYGSVNVAEESRQLQNEGEFPEVKVDFQETFLGHTSPISRCCFSASGNNIASASVDGTVRIWAYDSSIPTSRNATIYCGAEIMSLDWECKSDRLLLIGTADGGIKAWNADAKRVVCDLHTSEAFPSVLDLKCSPVEPIFVSAAASRRNGSSYIDSLGFASLTVWNMKTWRPMTVLPLGEDPPAITSLCFNHNGKILAASATDGMIHMFDMSAGLQITGWPAHDSAISSILFGPAETSIFSLGSDGKIFEWSLQNQGHVLWSRDCSRFCDTQNSKHSRHEMALDASGRRLLVTSGSVRAPIYQVRGYLNDLRSLPHTAAITTVDWHPTLPIFLTGSADHSIRVTSMS